MIDIYTVYIYNNESSRLERYLLDIYHDMPYTAYGSMTVPDFFGKSISTVGWTTSAFLRTWTSFSQGRVHPTNVFRRIFEGGHISQSMHYAGLAADVNPDNITATFPFIEANHVALSGAGYPELYRHSLGPFVFVLQDALMTLGFGDGSLDGFFGNETRNALNRFKSTHQLPQDGICDMNTWNKLCFLACGCGATPTVSKIKRKCEFYCSFSQTKL